MNILCKPNVHLIVCHTMMVLSNKRCTCIICTRWRGLYAHFHCSSMYKWMYMRFHAWWLRSVPIQLIANVLIRRNEEKKTKINWMNENYMLHSLWEKLIIPTFKCSINDQFIPLAYAQFGHYELFINQLTKYVFVYFCFHRTNYIFHIVHNLRFGFCPKVLTWIAVAWYIRVYTVEVCPHFSFYCC